MREIRDIHEPFIIWLRERSIPYIYHRPDTKSGIQTGHPDFTLLWHNRSCMIECKTEKGKLSPDQVKRIDFLQRSGCSVTIARSLEECCEAARSILTDSGHATDTVASFPDHFREKFTEMREKVDAVGKDSGHVPDLGKTFIGQYRGVPWVFEGSGAPGTQAQMVRRATQSDLMNISIIETKA